MKAELEAWLGEQLGRVVAIAELARITTGHSRAMYRCVLDDGQAFVVRAEQGGVFGTSGHEEFRVMQGLGRAGFPVAQVRWAEPTGTVLGQPFFVMDWLSAALPSGREDRSTPAPVAADYVRTLHRLHQLDWQAAGIRFDLEPADPADTTHRQIDRWAETYRAAADEPIPLLEEAAAWLHRHAPPLARMSVVHGDAGPGNFVHDGERVVAFTDWEFAHLGDPREDWVYTIAMRGARTLTPAEWRALFAAEAGVTLTDDEVRYWSAYNFFKGACANRTTLAVFESGANPAPNMAAIGATLGPFFMRQMATLIHGA